MAISETCDDCRTFRLSIAETVEKGVEFAA